MPCPRFVSLPLHRQSVRWSSWEQSCETFPLWNAHLGQIYKNTSRVYPMLYSFYFYCRFPIHYTVQYLRMRAHISIFEVWNRQNVLQKEYKVQTMYIVQLTSGGEGMGSASCIISINEISRCKLSYLRTRTFFRFMFYKFIKQNFYRNSCTAIGSSTCSLEKQMNTKTIKRKLDILVWIRIRMPGSAPVTNRSGSCYFQDGNKKLFKFLRLLLI